MILNIRAPKKPSTWKPVTNREHNKMITALMTKRNNPSVRIVTGKVKSTKMGFTIKLSKPRTTATIMETLKLVTDAILGKK
jgi:hypothetical protein